DVVLKMNGVQIKDNRDLSRKVAALRAGETANFLVWRDGKQVSVAVTVQKRPGEDRLSRNSPRGDGKDSKDASTGEAKVSALGLNLATITQQVRNQYDLEGAVKGVLITDVDPDSDAAERGLSAGDRIIAVAGDEVSSVDDIKSAIGEAKAQKRPSVLLFVET